MDEAIRRVCSANPLIYFDAQLRIKSCRFCGEVERGVTREAAALLPKSMVREEVTRWVGYDQHDFFAVEHKKDCPWLLAQKQLETGSCPRKP